MGCRGPGEEGREEALAFLDWAAQRQHTQPGLHLAAGVLIDIVLDGSERPEQLPCSLKSRTVVTVMLPEVSQGVSGHGLCWRHRTAVDRVSKGNTE